MIWKPDCIMRSVTHTKKITVINKYPKLQKIIVTLISRGKEIYLIHINKKYRRRKKRN